MFGVWCLVYIAIAIAIENEEDGVTFIGVWRTKLCSYKYIFCYRCLVQIAEGGVYWGLED